MTILRIQHPVASFEAWKRAFDADPMGRKAAGVSRLRVYRSATDPLFVAVELELGDAAQAEALLAKLRRLWSGPAKDLMKSPEAWIFESVESREV